MEQSMTMSMISSMTPDDFNQEEDLYGKDYNLNSKKTTSPEPGDTLQMLQIQEHYADKWVSE